MSIFASLHPFVEGGEINGRKIANQGFLRALLSADPFEQYHFFVGNQADMLAGLEPWSGLPALARGAVKIMGRPELYAQLRNNIYNVFHFSDPFSGTAAMAMARNSHSRHIFPITALNHTISYAEYSKSFLGLLWGGCCARDAIGANSNAAAAVIKGWFSFLRSSYHLAQNSFCQPQVKTMPMGVFVSDFAKNRDEARLAMRTKLGCAQNQTIFLLFGRITAQDKMDHLPVLAAMRRIKRDRPDLAIKVIISGFAKSGESMPDFLRAVGAGDALDLCVLPSPSEDEKIGLFAAADVFISPSDNIQETFGLSLLEAGASALPCIASDWNGYRDIIIDGVTGLLIPTMIQEHTPQLDDLAQAVFDNQHHFLRAQQTVVLVPALASAMIRLAENQVLRAAMGQAALSRIREHFDWGVIINKWLKLWSELSATPISPEEEKLLRAAKHPLALPFGQNFAPYASAMLNKKTMLRCTELGLAARSRRFPLEACLHANVDIDANIIFQMLTIARRAITADELVTRLNLDTERGNGVILWALKQDLLELAD